VQRGHAASGTRFERIDEKTRQRVDAGVERGRSQIRGDARRQRAIGLEVPGWLREVVARLLRFVARDATDRVVELAARLERARIDELFLRQQRPALRGEEVHERVEHLAALVRGQRSEQIGHGRARLRLVRRAQPAPQPLRRLPRSDAVETRRLFGSHTFVRVDGVARGTARARGEQLGLEPLLGPELRQRRLVLLAPTPCARRDRSREHAAQRRSS
jgi:hypothetical protein